MKQGIHPNYSTLEVRCVCGNVFHTRSTLSGVLNIEICSVCHPFYTGKQKIIDTEGRVGRFQQKYGMQAA